MKNIYSNAGQQRILKLIFVLFGDITQGYQPAELTRRVGCSPSATTRDLHNLLEAGVAERVERTGNWRLTANKFPNQAIKVYSALQRSETEHEETKSGIKPRI